jgi:hypothetical protein
MLLCSLFLFTSCKKRVTPTTVEVEDQDRHYYPVLQGQNLDLNYGVLNTGDHPLFITEIQPSCGCMIVNKKLPQIILPHKKGYIHIKYNSTKNVGYVQHFIRCYGNFYPTGRLELRFDVNIVPNADYTRDYEELYRDDQAKNGGVKEAVDGKTSERGYYVGQP